jgi:hypothetical protein
MPNTPTPIKIAAMASVPRLGFTDHFQSVLEALVPLGLRLRLLRGVYWHQELEKELERSLAEGTEWALLLDYDTVLTAAHVRRLLGVFLVHPELDALAALQPSRTRGLVLASGHGTEPDAEGLLRARTAHFGLTVLRMQNLPKLSKPWFHSRPAPDGTWGPGHKDADILFWHMWEAAGCTLAIDTCCCVGHLELNVLAIDSAGEVVSMDMADWREMQCRPESDSSKTEPSTTKTKNPSSAIA